jgi:YHS domain-containing protein
MQISIINQIKATTRYCHIKKCKIFLYLLIIFSFNTGIFTSDAILSFAEPQNVKVEQKAKPAANLPVPALSVSLVPMIGISDMAISDPHSGVALYGFDPVTYFIDQQAKQGQKQFETQFSGLIWQFSNEGNRAVFIANPESYYPQFGGHDPVLLQKDQIVAGDPKIFLVLGVNLYLFRTAENKESFIGNEALRSNANQKWVNIKHNLVKPH